MSGFNGLGMGLHSVSRLSQAQTRSISAENPTGAPGQGGRATEGTGASAARDLGPGWKISPSINLTPNQTFTLCDIQGMGAIQQIWLTSGTPSRFLILRIYWDGQTQPSVEVPAGDFFANPWNTFAQVSALPICVNTRSGFNSYWEMPFRSRCRITITNMDINPWTVYYQINYTLTDVPDDCAYFHAQFRRTNPLPYKVPYTILDGVQGQGQYVGTAMAWGTHNTGWWGEGEIKFYMDDDTDYPTICGTGTEDYFGGAWCFENNGGYQTYTGPYCGLQQVIKPDGFFTSQTRFSLYRFHIMDPIRFAKDLRVTIQALGWRDGGRYLPLQDDLASVAYWYQTLPTAPFPTFPSRDQLEII